MKATKGNKVYTIDQTQQERYVKEGFDILDDINAIKIVIRGVLHYLGIRRQQFWGWRRTRD